MVVNQKALKYKKLHERIIRTRKDTGLRSSRYLSGARIRTCATPTIVRIQTTYNLAFINHFTLSFNSFIFILSFNAMSFSL